MAKDYDLSIEEFRLKFRRKVDLDKRTSDWKDEKKTFTKLVNWRKHVHADAARGLNLGEMEKRYGLTRQRVHQILKEAKLYENWKAARKEVRKRRAEKRIEEKSAATLNSARMAAGHAKIIGFNVRADRSTLYFDDCIVKRRTGKEMWTHDGTVKSYYRETFITPGPRLYEISRWGRSGRVWIFTNLGPEEKFHWYAGEHVKPNGTMWPEPAEVADLIRRGVKVATWYNGKRYENCNLIEVDR